ncbi:FHA domain-containing protein [Mycobacterium paraseoulense]|uniref:FHA domain-containing protein n=1 Tax=Mycobacterium paraseoulense TaxID=590652 RepID=A0A1X0ICF5_9MYCO|nr:FHA domain-containing protein [Mycobacterium paraseoulense]MCV7396620.1 FHA domain-containing protein [Mycobacterium paraseoulense]ORB42088.1 FHA domain-containing protein [Mycobacterium paraseoulense]BBZ72523.1 glycogen accumulation regulator GarA [Mycobacterium paraseoulense]
MSNTGSTPHRPTQREGSEELTGDIGTAVPAEFDAPATQAAGGDRPALSPGSALLVVTRGPNAGSRFPLNQPVMAAGRHPESDIYLDDITVSRRHAEFLSEGGQFRIVDVGSMNHTYLNREPVDEAVLADGDEIQIGRVRLLFVTDA